MERGIESWILGSCGNGHHGRDWSDLRYSCVKWQAPFDACHFCSRSVIADIRDQTNHDDHEGYDPSDDLSETDPINSALKADFEINRENWFLSDWRLNHFGLPFDVSEGGKNERTSRSSRDLNSFQDV